MQGSSTAPPLHTGHRIDQSEGPATAACLRTRRWPSGSISLTITRITPFDFQYAHTLGHTIRLVCAARQTSDGLALSVRPTLIPTSAILASVQGAYNAIWVRGHYADYRNGAGLFGNPKLRCVFWIPEHQRGNAELGDVIDASGLSGPV